MTKAILWLTIIWLPVLMLWILCNEAKFKKNIVIGVTFPEEGKSDENIQQILNTYKKQETAVCIILILLAIAGWLIDSPHYFTIYMVWILFVVLFPYIPYIQTNLRLKDYKREKGWTVQPDTVYADTGAVGNTKLLDAKLFIPPVILCLVPLLYDRSFAVLYLMFALMCASFWLGYRYLYRDKAEMFNADTGVTNALSRMRRRNWGRVWLVLSWFMAFTVLAMSVPARYQGAAFTFVMAVSVLMVVYCVYIEMKTRKVQERLTEENGTDLYIDEDDHWPFGLFYYNPDDDHLIINNRTGMNTTVNLARPAGKVLTAFSFLLITALPFMGLAFDSAGTKPIEMELTEEELSVKTGWSHYEVEREEIAGTQLLDQLPDNLSRKWGTAVDHLLSGRFSSEQYSSLTLLLDPDVPPYILVETQDGQYYIFNTREADETRRIYEELNP